MLRFLHLLLLILTVEFKVASGEASLRQAAEVGLRQIAEKAYDHDTSGVRIRWGIAFWKKAYDHDTSGVRIRWGIAFWKQSVAVACEQVE